MYDRQTLSLWSHVTGKAVKGPFQGAVLTVYSTSMQTTWAQWRRLHPRTLVLSGSTWRALEGVAVAGKLKGQRLGQVAGTTAFWFAWKQIYPHTAIWRPH